MKRLIILAAMSGMTAAASASTITFNFSNPLQQTEINQSANLGLFNSALGTLTGAVLTVSGQALFNFSGHNGSTQSQVANIAPSTLLIFSTTLAPLQSLINDALIFSESSGAQVYDAGQTRTFGPSSESATASDDLASLLGSLQSDGGGVFGLTCQSLSGITVLGGGGNISTTQSTQAACGATITYTFTAGVFPPDPNSVPEPSSLALIGVGLAGLAALCKRERPKPEADSVVRREDCL